MKFHDSANSSFLIKSALHLAGNGGSQSRTTSLPLSSSQINLSCQILEPSINATQIRLPSTHSIWVPILRLFAKWEPGKIGSQEMTCAFCLSDSHTHITMPSLPSSICRRKFSAGRPILELSKISGLKTRSSAKKSGTTTYRPSTWIRNSFIPLPGYTSRQIWPVVSR